MATHQLAMADGINFPIEVRDQFDQAREYYNQPLRRDLERLKDENRLLKALLREHGISLEGPFGTHPAAAAGQIPGNHVSNSLNDNGRRSLPTLPPEIQYQIVEEAMISNHPIIDPLSKLDPVVLTDFEKTTGPQIAIGCLAVSTAFYEIANRTLWSKNVFTFTSHTALRNFARLPLRDREKIKHVNLRITTKLYDDKEETRTIYLLTHTTGKRPEGLPLIVHHRPIEPNRTMKGFRCYSWTQLVDFLDALRPPFEEGNTGVMPRPRLLPNLEKMRIDFVNFVESHPIEPPDHTLHTMASYDLGCTLNELMVTGLPCTEPGMQIGRDLSRMVKHNGLFMDASLTFVQTRDYVRRLDGYCYIVKLIRYPPSVLGPSKTWGAITMPVMAPCPREGGHPQSDYVNRRTTWKRIPLARDSEKRAWAEFDYATGLPIDDHPDVAPDEEHGDEQDYEWGDEPDFKPLWHPDIAIDCPKCGTRHGPFGIHDF